MLAQRTNGPRSPREDIMRRHPPPPPTVRSSRGDESAAAELAATYLAHHQHLVQELVRLGPVVGHG